METLRDRLDAVQEELLTLYEEGNTDIDSQIKHWNLLRREHVLLHFARKQGIYRLGLQTVPPLQVSQQKAKEAIEMVLTLQSLKKSPYGEETWTLADTSRELFETPPKNCFKKHGASVEVRYDGSAANSMLYTAWSDIYYQTDYSWEKTQGHVDYTGCYYYEDDVKIYYLKFEDDAARYSATGEWEVHYKNDIFSPVASVSSTSSWTPSPVAATSTGGTAEDTQQYPVPLDNTPATVKRRRTGSPSRTTKRGRPRRKPRSSTPRGRFSAQEEGRRRSQQEEGQRQRRTQQRQQGERARSPRLPEESARQVAEGAGRRHRRSRLDQLLADAADPPIVLLRGGANQLKCLRYRLIRKYSALFSLISSTWSWVGLQGPGGRNRLMLAFNGYQQRTDFINSVPLPPGVSVVLGTLQGI
ncbi:E2 protein [Pudu puda papillomavirus 1]|uniref:Regulatory protein E2 n=1 Tax=Pudu puda papillomavirus 1 TaxID=1747360 RepID=A0A1I9KI98_9PAPI|nr:E2 protein [Pudu puda papillomavirus 1]ALP46954.1 E2 protein [Pudu puda papillomavirus 1]